MQGRDDGGTRDEAFARSRIMTGGPEPMQVDLAGLTAVVTGIMVAIMQGDSGFINLLPLWAAIGGIVIWNYYRSIKYYRK